MKTAQILLVIVKIACCCVDAEGLSPDLFVHFLRRGAIFTYAVDATKCDLNLPPTIQAYSFGDVLTDVYLEYTNQTQWRMYTANERPVNSSRFQIQNGVWRVTEVQLTPDNLEDGTALVTISDIEEGGDAKVLASGTLSCKISTGGFKMQVQHVGGSELPRESIVMVAFQRGDEMTFVVDLSTCSKQGEPYSRLGIAEPLTDDVSIYRTARLSGYRVPPKVQHAVEFTSQLAGPREWEVFSVLVHAEDQIRITAYTLVRSTHEPSPVTTYSCSLGVSGGFHVYRL